MPQPRKHAGSAERQAAYRRRQAELGCKLTGTASVAGSTYPWPQPSRISLKPGYRRWQMLLADAQRRVQATAEEMQSYYDERSEKWREERGEEFMDRLDAVLDIDAAFDQLPEP